MFKSLKLTERNCELLRFQLCWTYTLQTKSRIVMLYNNGPIFAVAMAPAKRWKKTGNKFCPFVYSQFPEHWQIHLNFFRGKNCGFLWGILFIIGAGFGSSSKVFIFFLHMYLKREGGGSPGKLTGFYPLRLSLYLLLPLSLHFTILLPLLQFTPNGPLIFLTIRLVCKSNLFHSKNYFSTTTTRVYAENNNLSTRIYKDQLLTLFCTFIGKKVNNNKSRVNIVYITRDLGGRDYRY